MLLGEAISLVCSDLCLQVHAVLVPCTRPLLVSPGKFSTDVTTWIVANTHFFTLIKQETSTLAYCHGNQTLYYAQPDFWLGAGFPTGHAILTQVCEDRIEDKVIPRLLAMDLVHPLVKNPRERGEILRRVCACSLPPSISIQWSGKLEALRPFLASGLPHDVEGVVELTQNPLRLHKEMSIKVPPVAALAEAISTEVSCVNNKRRRRAAGEERHPKRR